MNLSDLIVFTDLDGTLLDHATYDFTPALPALNCLHANGVPWVLVTSKTRAEVVPLRRDLGHTGPFVVENGGALYVPHDLFPFIDGPVIDGLREIVLGVPYVEIRAALCQLRADLGVAFSGFGDVSDAEVARWTGLPVETAALARQRACSEPLRFSGDQSALVQLDEGLARAGLRLVRGGRFWSAQGLADKGIAVRQLVRWFARNRPVHSVGLGDSPNDLPMLRAVDTSIVIPPGHGRAPLQLDKQDVIIAGEAGPAGFCLGLREVFARYDVTL